MPQNLKLRKLLLQVAYTVFALRNPQIHCCAAAQVRIPPDMSNSHVRFGLGVAVRRHLHQRQQCADSDLCKVTLTAHSYLSFVSVGMSAKGWVPILELDSDAALFDK
jgi:hypothetical protein